ncbi:MFS transporter [Nordella sp. HKS 07]|uniref:MFS transporter n=1 Tax=Nordella sp. HKS 07 TaxID=2712222 RepID=UPI0013E182EB|nr:MFS transporter [Nordella sp. HKS 07]QIG48688.1 MFS transporter [Nordella sp. HKS 07]
MEARSRTTKAQFALSLSLTINTTGQTFLLVVLPPLGRRLGFTDIQTGIILSISALLLMASAPVWGYLSERIGRRPVLLTALAGAAIAAAGFGAIVDLRLAGTMSAVLTLGLFILIRAAQSIACGGILPAAQAYMADITTPAQRAGGMGILGAAIGLGAILGAALAWQVAPTDPALAFAIVAALAISAFASVLLLAREPARGAPNYVGRRPPAACQDMAPSPDHGDRPGGPGRIPQPTDLARIPIGEVTQLRRDAR